MRRTLKKQSVILVLVVLTAITFSTLKSEVQAAEQWYTASVVAAGPGWGSAFICLTASGVFTSKYMVARSDQSKEQLATALTALSSGKNVMIYADNSLSLPTIQAIYLISW